MKPSLIFLCLILLASCTSQKNSDDHSPEASLADLKVYDGLEVTLFASEPMLTNPTNMDIDSRGRVWITEAYNYRNQYNPKNPEKKEGDRIMILEDTDGDGKADKSKVFYQGTDVNAALGICVLGNKVIVSCSPNVFVFTDENGDDVPDKKEVMFQGIKGLQNDHAIHAFTFAYDGRLYFNMGNAGSVLVDAKGDTVIDIHGRKVVTNGKPFRDGLALRCDLDGSNVEVLGHNFRNNYELTVDPYGTVWQSDNDDDGNKATRLNYVMEFGNFGFKDEMTGASWPTRRTNMEATIPARHWHLNDPGVVPVLLQNGSGSPAGITMYEGIMLPREFQGHLIHAEPGHNVVRGYPIENEGAGYKASTIVIVEGQKDQWFRPVDVTIAPDGSLFIADWYDPGVGGHAAGDTDRGRVYRVAKPGASYNVAPPDFTLAEGVMKAFLSPNAATRYLGWTELAKLGDKAEPNLKQLWKADDQRQRAMALWHLVRLSNGDDYLQQALTDTIPNIRIQGIRAARLLKKDILPITAKMVNDLNPQVRREVALAIRGKNNQEAADQWTQLALQYDGQDRWYLEALGISAEGNWDLCFNTWRKKIGKEWNGTVGRSIVWRSRSKDAMPLLAQLIDELPERLVFRYFRAFDFHTDPSKQEVLAKLVTKVDSQKVFYALKHMNSGQIKMTPPINVAMNKTLNTYKNRIEFVELVTNFKRKDRTNDLLRLAIDYPDSAFAKESAKTLVNWGETDLLASVLKGKDPQQAIGLAKSLDPMMYNSQTITLMEQVVLDSTRDLELRKVAMRTFGGNWESEDRLLALAKDKKITSDLQTVAAGVFQNVWRAKLRDEAAQYLKLPGNKEGAQLPTVSVLVDKKGSVEAGKLAFVEICQNCHTVNGEGVNFGPDLSEIGSKLSKEALYSSILYPDQGINFGYEGYSFRMSDGSSAFGRILSETSTQVDLQYMTTQQTLDKSKIVSRTKLESSLMPSNLQATLTEQELVDLVEYLMGLKKKVLTMN